MFKILYNHLKEIYVFLAVICSESIADEAFRNVPDSVLPYSERPTLLPYNTRQGNAPGECPGFARQDSEIGGRVNGALKAAPAVAVEPTNGYCANRKAPGGCQLHNLQCGYPQCDQRSEERRVGKEC